MTTAFRTGNENKDYAYSATTSVMSASTAMARRFHNSVIAAVIFPVIIVDGYLFQSHLSEAGEMELRQVDEAVLLWKYQSMEHPNAIINVVKKPLLKEFVDRCQKTADALFSIDKEQLGRILGRPTGDISSDDPRIDF